MLMAATASAPGRPLGIECAGDPPPSLAIQTVDEPWPIGHFAACHHPQTVAGRYVLPAFGEFTGGWNVERQPGRELYAVGGQVVWRVPGGR